jgi:3-hydroxyisobutyrate dehydrogenase
MSSDSRHPLTVALLGTGIMGGGMARNLLAAGHRVRAWNRTISRAKPLAQQGVEVVADPAEAVRDADAVVTMLLDGPATLDAMRIAVSTRKDGAVWLQSATVGVEAVGELAALAAAHDLLFFDSPVAGSREVAESGQLAVMAAGPAEGRPVAQRVFDAVGRKTVWLDGDPATGPATRLKLEVNNWVLSLTATVGETIALAEAVGVDPEVFLGMISGGPTDAPYLHAKAQAILSGDFSPNFTLTGAAKDLRLIVTAGEAAGVRMDVAAAGAERFRRAAEQGHGGEDMAAGYFASFPEGKDGKGR